MNIKISKKSVIKEFKLLKENKFLGVNGIIKIDSGKPGPVLGLTVCTHGNELAGLVAVYYLRNKYDLGKKLLKGSVLIVINNLKATEKSLNARTETESLNSRYIDLNFNRLPKNLSKIRSDSRYEISRAQELLPIWSLFDVALDIHSTTQDNPPMIIASDNLDFDLVRDFPIKIVISNIVKIQIGVPAFAFYGGDRDIQTIEIESGQHEKVSSGVTAIKCILSLLGKLKMVDYKSRQIKRKNFEEYYVNDSIIFPNRECELGRVFESFKLIKKGELLATVNGKKIIAREDCCALMAPKGIKPTKVGEEAVFLSKLVKIKIL